jgi:hypothetical protein
MLEVALEHVNAQLGAFAVFSIAVPIAEWANAKELLVVIREALRLEPELQQWSYSDLSDDNNFEMLFKVYANSPVPTLRIRIMSHAFVADTKELEVSPTSVRPPSSTSCTTSLQSSLLDGERTDCRVASRYVYPWQASL